MDGLRKPRTAWAAAMAMGSMVAINAMSLPTGGLSSNTVLLPVEPRVRKRKRKGKHKAGVARRFSMTGAPPSNGVREMERRRSQLTLGKVHDAFEAKGGLVCAYRDRKFLRGPNLGAVLRRCNMGTVLLASERTT